MCGTTKSWPSDKVKENSEFNLNVQKDTKASCTCCFFSSMECCWSLLNRIIAKQQIKDIRRKYKCSSGSLDPTHSVMMMWKDTIKDFVRAVTGAPDYMVFWLLAELWIILFGFCSHT